MADGGFTTAEQNKPLSLGMLNGDSLRQKPQDDSVLASAVASIWHGDPNGDAAHYVVGGLKTAALFLGGTKGNFLGKGGAVGLAATVALYGLDRVGVHDDAKTAATNFALGGLEGGLTKGLFHGMGEMGIQNWAAKGVVLGAGNRGIHELTTPSTFTDANGNLSVGQGLLDAGARVFDPKAMITDAALFGVAHGMTRGANWLAGGAIDARPLYNTVITSSSFGLSSGAYSEYSKQRAEGGNIDFGKVLTHGLIQGGVDALAGVPGGVVADSGFRGAPRETLRHDVATVKNNLGVVGDNIRNSTSSLFDPLKMDFGPKPAFAFAVEGTGNGGTAGAVEPARPYVAMMQGGHDIGFEPATTGISAPSGGGGHGGFDGGGHGGGGHSGHAEHNAAVDHATHAPIEVNHSAGIVGTAHSAGGEISHATLSHSAGGEISHVAPSLVPEVAHSIAGEMPHGEGHTGVTGGDSFAAFEPSSTKPVANVELSDVLRPQQPVATVELSDVLRTQPPVETVELSDLLRGQNTVQGVDLADLSAKPTGASATRGIGDGDVLSSAADKLLAQPAKLIDTTDLQSGQPAPVQPHNDTAGILDGDHVTGSEHVTNAEGMKSYARTDMLEKAAEHVITPEHLAQHISEFDKTIASATAAKPTIEQAAELYKFLQAHPELDQHVGEVYQKQFENKPLRQLIEGFYKPASAMDHEESLKDPATRQRFDQLMDTMNQDNTYSSPRRMQQAVAINVTRAQERGIDLRPALEHLARTSFDPQFVRAIDGALGTNYMSLMEFTPRELPVSHEVLVQKEVDQIAVEKAKTGKVSTEIPAGYTPSPEALAKAAEITKQVVADHSAALKGDDVDAARQAAVELANRGLPNIEDYFDAWKKVAPDSVPFASVLNTEAVKALPAETVRDLLTADWSGAQVGQPEGRTAQPSQLVTAKLLTLSKLSEAFADKSEIADQLIKLGKDDPASLQDIATRAKGQNSDAYKQWVEQELAKSAPIADMAGEHSVNKATLYSAFKDSPDVAQKLLDIAAADPNFDLSGLVRRIGHPKQGEQFRELVKSKVEAGATAADLGSEGLWAEFQVRKQFGRTPDIADKLVLLGKADPAGLQDLLKEPGSDAPKPRGPRTNGPPVRDAGAKALSFAYKDMIGALVPQATSLAQLQSVASAIKAGKFEAAFKAALPIRPADDGAWTHTQLLMSGVAQQSADMLPKQQKQPQDGQRGNGPGGRGPQTPPEQNTNQPAEPQPDLQHYPDDPTAPPKPIPGNELDRDQQEHHYPEQEGGFYPEQGGGYYPDQTNPTKPGWQDPFDDQFGESFVARTRSKGAMPPVPGGIDSSIGLPSTTIADVLRGGNEGSKIDDTGVKIPALGDVATTHDSTTHDSTTHENSTATKDATVPEVVVHDASKDLLNPAGGIRVTADTAQPGWTVDQPATVDQKVLDRRAAKAARKAAKRQDRYRPNGDDWQ